MTWAQLALLDVAVLRVLLVAQDLEARMVPSALMVAWAHAVPPVLLETRVLKAQRVLRAPLEVLGPEAIRVSQGLKAPPVKPAQEVQQAPAQILATRVLPASMAHPVLAVPMARSVILAVKAQPVARALLEDVAKLAPLVIRVLRAQRAPQGLLAELVKRDLLEIPAPPVIWAEPDYKDCAGPPVHPAILEPQVIRALLAASAPRVREAIQVIQVPPVLPALLVVLVPEDQEAIQVIPAHKEPRAQPAPQVLKGLAVQSA